MGARRDQRSHPSAPLYYPGNASVQQADQLSGSLQFTFSQILGEIADAQVPESAVTQHEAALEIAASQITSGTLADARVAESNVTQHEAALAIDGSQVTDATPTGQYLKDDGTYDTPAGTGGSIDGHTDVDTTTDPPAVGEQLTWDGTNWVPGAAGGSGGSPATAAASGTVKVNTDDPGGDPVVYRIEEVDTLLDAKQDTLARGDVVITTASLAVDAEETGTVTLGKSGLILKVVADRACWVRFYGTSAERTADAARLITEDPSDDVPVLADLIFSASLLTIPTAPLIGYTNRDGSPATTIYYSIINKSAGSSTVAVTVSRLSLEA
jgi:hypothetical protein